MSHVLAFSMSQHLPTWQQWLNDMWASGAGLGLLLLLGGFTFIFFGHSLYKIFTAVAFAFLGWWLTSVCKGIDLSDSARLIAPLVGGVVLGAASYPLAKYGVALLGGIAAAGICWQLFGGAGPGERLVLGLCGLCLVGVTALAIVRHDEVAVFASTVFGAVMVVSGTVALFARFPSIGATYHHLMMRYPLVVWVSFITPLVIGLAFQLATLKNKGKATLQ